MKAGEKLRGNNNVGQRVHTAVEKLAEFSHPTGFDNVGHAADMKQLRFMKTEDNAYTDAKSYEIQDAHILNNVHENTKKELSSDEEFLDDKSGSSSGSYYLKDNQHDPAFSDAQRVSGQAHCKGIYNCEFCSRCFKEKRYLKSHLITHAKDRKREFVCESCGSAFYSKGELVRHIKDHTGYTHNCQVCGLRLTKKANLLRHMRRKHTNQTQLFNSETETQDNPSVHTKISDKTSLDKENGSDVASYAPANKQSNPVIIFEPQGQQSEKTQFTSDAETPDSASVCTKTEIISQEEFFYEENVSVVTSYNQENQQTASVFSKQEVTVSVGEGSESYEPAVRQISQSHSEGSCVCDFCPSSFKTKKCLENHIAGTHRDQHIHKCELCLRTFKKKRYLKSHLVSHAKDRRREFFCNSCESAYYTKRDLMRHSRIHTGDTYNCQVCGARFTEKGNLKAHTLRKHSLKEEFLNEENDPGAFCPTQENQQSTRMIAYERQSQDTITENNSETMRSFKDENYLKNREFACHSSESADLMKDVRIRPGNTTNCETSGSYLTKKDPQKSHMLNQNIAATQQFPLDPQTRKDAAVLAKTELVSDEEFIDEGKAKMQ